MRGEKERKIEESVTIDRTKMDLSDVICAILLCLSSATIAATQVGIFQIHCTVFIYCNFKKRFYLHFRVELWQMLNASLFFRLESDSPDECNLLFRAHGLRTLSNKIFDATMTARHVAPAKLTA